ncbi:hypothetical protein DWF04_015365 [Cereibacter sphaeroides f. sp. denitrificans]
MLGAVYGFGFTFAPKKHQEVHPGLVIGIKELDGSRVQVLALPISHKDPLRGEPHLVIPLQERINIGLDPQQQCVYYSRFGMFTMPGAARKLMKLDAYYVGNASSAFWKEARDRFLEHRKDG